MTAENESLFFILIYVLYNIILCFVYIKHCWVKQITETADIQAITISTTSYFALLLHPLNYIQTILVVMSSLLAQNQLE